MRKNTGSQCVLVLKADLVCSIAKRELSAPHDHSEAVAHLLAALHERCSEDCENLLSALKNGTLSRTGKKHSSSEMSDMKRTSVFRERCSKCLRKKLHKHETICQNLDDWFCRHKVATSDEKGLIRFHWNPCSQLMRNWQSKIASKKLSTCQTLCL